MKLYNDDCFNVFPTLAERSIDLVLCDMPYGTTACKWDTVIDLDRMWTYLDYITDLTKAVVLFGIEPFSSKLRMSNINGWKYDWIWHKSIASGFMNAKKAPMNDYEIISVFSRGTIANRSLDNMVYNPQNLTPLNKLVKGKKTGSNEHAIQRNSHKDIYVREFTNYPKRVLHIPSEGKTVHPTQKPVALMEYLIKTYSNEGDTVLDFCMGSGTTGVACKNLNRQFIGIEKEENYFNIAKERIDNA